MNKTLIESAVVVPELQSVDRDAALDEVLQAMVAAGRLKETDRATVLAQLIEREAQGSTGLGNGVAVPHVKEASVDQIVVGAAVTQAGIGFDAIDGRPVHIVFVVLGPADGAPEDHLAVLRWVSTLARNADFRRFAMQATTAEAMQDLLVEMSEG